MGLSTLPTNPHPIGRGLLDSVDNPKKITPSPMWPRCGPDMVQTSLTCPDVAQIWPRCGPDAAQMWPRYGPDVPRHHVQILPRCGPDVAQIWSRYGPDVARMLPRHHLHVQTWPRCGPELVQMWPRCGLDIIYMSKRGPDVAQIWPCGFDDTYSHTSMRSQVSCKKY